MWIILALEQSVILLTLLCRFTEELWTRSAGEGGSHWRHDRAALPPTGGSPCCWGKTDSWDLACSQEWGRVLCGHTWSERATVWHSCCLDSADKDDEEIVKEGSWKSTLAPVYFLVDTELLLGSLNRIWSVFLLSVTSDHAGGIFCVLSQLPWAFWYARGLWINLSSSKRSHVSAQRRRDGPSVKCSGVCTYSFFMGHTFSEHLLCVRHCAGMRNRKSGEATLVKWWSLWSVILSSQWGI